VHFDPAVLLTFPVFLLSIIVHECAHAWAALKLGDSSARDEGRLTLNPLPHIDWVGSVIVPGVLLALRAPFLFGWAKPVLIDWAKLRRPHDDQVKVALAGPASNFLLALCFAALVRLAPERGFWAPLEIMGVAGVYWNCALGLFNLIPVPPLDGSWVLMRFLPLRHIIVLQQFRYIGMAAVVAMLSTPMIADPVVHRPLRLAVHACFELFGVSLRGVGL
jgi:Zn-dependent protease